MGHKAKLEPIDPKAVYKVVDSLSPIKVAVESLGSNSTDIYAADVIIHTLLSELYELNTQISQQLAAAIQQRMKERRNKNLASLAKFLQDPKGYSRNKESSEYLSYCSKEQVYTEATKLLARLYGPNENNVDDATTPTSNSRLDVTEGPVDFRMKLQAAISDACRANSGRTETKWSQCETRLQTVRTSSAEDPKHHKTSKHLQISKTNFH